MIKIIVADDHCLMREGLRAILSSDPELEVIGEATNGGEVLDLARECRADLLLLDLSMPGTCGIDLIKRVRTRAPGLGILVLTMHSAEHYAVRSFRAGAKGFLTKDNAPAELVSAVRQVARGAPYIDRNVAEQLAFDVVHPKDVLPHSRLSDRELQIFSMLVSGGSVTATAVALSLSVKTVSTHKTRILQKLDMDNFPQMVQYALEYGLMRQAGLESMR
jgi:DNA-binding NarL/FixJ family response regulator